MCLVLFIVYPNTEIVTVHDVVAAIFKYKNYKTLQNF